jgi:hypothetical protein
MSTCNRLELQTLGSQPIMPKNLPDHWMVHYSLKHIHDSSKVEILEPNLPHGQTSCRRLQIHTQNTLELEAELGIANNTFACLTFPALWQVMWPWMRLQDPWKTQGDRAYNYELVVPSPREFSETKRWARSHH